MSTHRFDKGDRIYFRHNGPETSGTITARITSPDGEDAYRVRWDDGFKEEYGDAVGVDVWANVWVERELLAEGEVPA